MYTLIDQLRNTNPLVVHYTNEVTINDCANITLAIGASPLMSYSKEEVVDIVGLANSVVINIGTMNSAHMKLFLEAGKVANQQGKPVIFDPVGVFASEERRLFAKEFLQEVHCTVIKGNGAEIQYLGGVEAQGQGVDSLDNGDLTEIVRQTAKKLHATVVATGVVDVISDGEHTIRINNGSTRLKQVTGTGCMTGSLIGAFIGAHTDVVKGAAMGVLTMALAGQIAEENFRGTGSFKSDIMDFVSTINTSVYEKYASIEVL